MTAAGTERRPGLGLVWAGAFLLLVALVVAGIGVGGASSRLIDRATDQNELRVPGDATISLGDGDYVIYTATGRRGDSLDSSSLRFDPGAEVTLHPEDVSITDPDGQAVTTTIDTSDGTRWYSDREYEAALSFTAPRSGDYRLDVRTSDDGRVLVARPTEAVISSALGWAVLLPIAGVVGLIGLVLVIVGLVRRFRAPSGPAVPGGPPPVGYVPGPTYGHGHPGYPPAGYGPPGYPPPGSGPAGYPPPGYGPPGYPPAGYGPAGYPPPGYGPPGHPPPPGGASGHPPPGPGGGGSPPTGSASPEGTATGGEPPSRPPDGG